jgi:hypothetical protein
VPYSSLAEDTLKFVDAKYMPTGFNICDPRNLKKKQLQSFFEHIQSRQTTQSADQVFRFSHFQTRRHSQLQKALYGDQEVIPAVMSSNARPARQKAKDNTRGHDKDLENFQSTAASGHNLTDIASSETSNIAPSQESTTIINQRQMSRLLPHGYLTPIPINGPNDGPPQYEVPVETLDILSVPTPELPSTDLNLPGSPNMLAVDPVLLDINHQSEHK